MFIVLHIPTYQDKFLVCENLLEKKSDSDSDWSIKSVQFPFGPKKILD